MPWKPKQPCRHHGCGQLSNGPYCEMHKPGRVRQQGNKQYNVRWRKARLHFLDRHPLCITCLTVGRLVPATVVDHVIPHRGDQRLFWNEGNWQALCKPCHDRKTAKEDGGFGNTTVW